MFFINTTVLFPTAVYIGQEVYFDGLKKQTKIQAYTAVGCLLLPTYGQSVVGRQQQTPKLV